MKIYLAGPINGKTDAECNDWRDQIRKLAPEFEYLDPMARDYRGKEDDSVKDIVEGDKADIRKCHYMIANTRAPSAGTSMEILFAYHLGDLGGGHVRVVSIVGEKVSPWIRYHSDAVVTSEEAAVEAVRDFIDKDSPKPTINRALVEKIFGRPIDWEKTGWGK